MRSKNQMSFHIQNQNNKTILISEEKKKFVRQKFDSIIYKNTNIF